LEARDFQQFVKRRIGRATNLAPWLLMKKINPQHKTEKRGLNELQAIVTELGWIFRPTPNDDYGIDGEIEPVENESPSGKLLKVQVKSGTSYMRGITESEFYFLASADDLNYWSTGSLPVLVVIYDPQRTELYWKWIQGYLRKDSNALAARKIWFRRDADRLTAERADDLLKIAGDTSAAADVIPTAVAPHTEVLWSNLLRVTELPLEIYSAPTRCRTAREVRTLLGDRPKPPCIVRNGRLFTFSNLLSPEHPLLAAASSPQIDRDRTREWEGHVERERWLVELMNSALRKKCAHIGLEYDRDKARFYFRANGKTAVAVRYRASTRWIRRKVAYPYPEEAPRFWVHHATRLRFLHMGQTWFLQIDPAWIFTSDGVQLLTGERVGTLAIKRKAREYNQAVLNHLVFWREILSEGRHLIHIYPASGDQSFAVSKTFADGLATFGLRGDSRKLVQLEEATEFELIADDEEDNAQEEQIYEDETTSEA
jgi:Domain of unknown function (DUF4365)